MSNVNIEKLAEQMGSQFEAVAGEFARPIIPVVQSLLAERGTPVSPEQVAAALGWTREEAVALPEWFPVAETDEDGNFVTFAGLTLRPTSHLFEVEGRTLYTWCALDALLFPYAFIDKPAKVESPCPITGTPVRALVRPDGLEGVEPPEAAVSMVLPENVTELEEVRGSFCNLTNFFSSPEAARQWLEGWPNGIVLSTDEAFRLGHLLVDQLNSTTVSS